MPKEYLEKRSSARPRVLGVFILIITAVTPATLQEFEFDSARVNSSLLQTNSDNGAIVALGKHPVHEFQTADVWGYVDPATGKEYAIVGWGYFREPPDAGIVIFDVSNPGSPEPAAILNVPGFDCKIWKNYLYTVNGAGGLGRIINLADIKNPQLAGSFPGSHNIFISAKGQMYLASPGLRIYDLNPDPTRPALLWDDNKSSGHDATVIGDTLYDFHGSLGTFIYDVSKPASPEALSVITDPAVIFHHSGWPTADRSFLYICDEAAQYPTPDITIWDIRDLARPRKVGVYSDPDATVHNLYIVDRYAYVSYYTAGFRIFDVSDPARLVEVDRYRTSSSFGEGFNGAFGVYAFAPSRNIYVSDGQEGLFVFRFNAPGTAVWSPEPEVPEQLELHDSYPNPLRGNGGTAQTTMSFRLGQDADARLLVFNMLGQQVRELVNGVYSAGVHRVNWNGMDDSGTQLPAGLYFYRLESGTNVLTKRLLLLR